MSADLKMLESIQNTQSISREELGAILQTQDSFLIQELHKKAQQTATQIYGNKIYIRFDTIFYGNQPDTAQTTNILLQKKLPHISVFSDT